MKKATFCKVKISLSRNFVYNLQTFRWFCQVHFYDFVANLAWRWFSVPTGKHRQAKVPLFLGIGSQMLHLSLKFRLKCLEKRCHLGSGQPKIFRVTRANQNARKVPFTDLVNTKIGYYMTPIQLLPHTNEQKFTAHKQTWSPKVSHVLTKLLSLLRAKLTIIQVPGNQFKLSCTLALH